METKDIIKNLTGLDFKYNPNFYKGGDVLEPTGRFFEGNIYVVDFKRFYPHIILMNNIFGDKMSDYIKSLLISSLNDSGEAKDKSKLVLNSIYGMMKHYDFEGTKKTAEIGRNWIRLTRKILEQKGYKILSSDTDSVTIQGGDVLEVLKDTKYISNFINSLCVNPQKTFQLNIENVFKYIYFFPNSNGFKKKQYLGVRLDNSIVLKSRRLNYDEQLAWSFIADQLRKGKYRVNVEEFIKFAEEVFKKNETFINMENISIIEIIKQKVKL